VSDAGVQDGDVEINNPPEQRFAAVRICARGGGAVELLDSAVEYREPRHAAIFTARPRQRTLPTLPPASQTIRTIGATIQRSSPCPVMGLNLTVTGSPAGDEAGIEVAELRADLALVGIDLDPMSPALPIDPSAHLRVTQGSSGSHASRSVSPRHRAHVG
jgi:hypothetical protein